MRTLRGTLIQIDVSSHQKRKFGDRYRRKGKMQGEDSPSAPLSAISNKTKDSWTSSFREYSHTIY
jgi:hypothetical protein